MLVERDAVIAGEIADAFSWDRTGIPLANDLREDLFMRKLLLACLVVLCHVFIPATGLADTRGDVAQALDRFITAFNNLDWDRFRNAFANDVTLFNPDIPEAPSVDRLDGRQLVENGFRSVFEASRKAASGPP